MQARAGTALPLSALPVRGIRRSQLRQACRLLIRAGLLVLPFLLFLVGFEHRFARANPSHFAVKKERLERQASQIEILVLGSSHELTAIDPGALGKPAFNLASQSQSLYYDLSLIKKYRPALSALKLVILPISYFSLEYELNDAPERWRAFHYKYFYSLPHQDWRQIVSTRNYSTYFLSSESFRARVLLGKAANAALEYDAWGGWTNRPQNQVMDFNALAAAARASLRIHHGMMRQENLAGNVERLRETIRELRGAGIKVLFITSPVSRFYREGIRKDAYGRMQDALVGLINQKGAEYRNYMFDERFEDQDFADGDHLNWTGASKFTRILREEAVLEGERSVPPLPAPVK